MFHAIYSSAICHIVQRLDLPEFGGQKAGEGLVMGYAL
jgi:hypothetical protein